MEGSDTDVGLQKLMSNGGLPTATVLQSGQQHSVQQPHPVRALPHHNLRSRLNTRRAPPELIRKSGDCNVTFNNLNKRRSRYLQDLYTTLVDVQWRWTLLVFFMAFILSWLIFAFIWYMIITVHGDKELDANSTRQPCILNVNNFAGAFLYSIETQHTIGYGARVITEECPEAVFVLCIQSITGVILQAFMVGVVFAKLTRPKQRTNTILFSRNALICLRDGSLSLVFRVGDMRKSFVIGAQIRAQVIKERTTLEGEVIPFHQYELSVGCDDTTSDLFFIWPMTIVHTINPQSPFYTMSAVDLMNEQFELVVFLEGTTESTGTTMQARYSYQPSDILWGHRFENLIYFDKSSDNYVIDFRQFNKTKEVSTPLCSGKDLDEFRAQNADPLICYSPANSEQIVCLEPEIFSQMDVRVDD
ncbi:unnamed protein product, partial [Meganyctiphanes norvegica]